MTQGMIEECELVVTRQRRQPQRELGQIDGHRVFVHPIEATLRHHAGVHEAVHLRQAAARAFGHDGATPVRARPPVDGKPPPERLQSPLPGRTP